VLAFAMAWALKNTRWGLIVRLAGESVDAALAIGCGRIAALATRQLRLAGVPAGSAGVSAHYDWLLGGRSTLALDARYSYVGRSRLTFDAVTAPKMGDYDVGRIAATLSREPWRVTVAIDNPANVVGDTFAYGNPFSLRSVQQITPLRPRTLSVTLRADF